MLLLLLCWGQTCRPDFDDNGYSLLEFMHHWDMEAPATFEPLPLSTWTSRGGRVLLKLFAVTTPDEHTILVLLRRLCHGKAISHFPDMSFCGVVSPDLLVTQLHGELKRVLAADTGVHFTGLHQAASYCWRNAVLDGKTCKKLRALDIVNSYMKQISVIRCQQFACQVMSQLEEANKKGHITPGPVTEFLAPVPITSGRIFRSSFRCGICC